MRRIDAHIHWNGDHPAWQAYMEEADLSLINVCVALDAEGAWRDRDRYTRQRAEEHPERWAWIASFDLPRPGETSYPDRVIEGLEQDLAAGAIACKIWKNFGLKVRTTAGEWMMVDDPLLEPVFSFLARTGVPLLAHIGEPLACWQPLDPASPHYGYYSHNPKWHLYGKSGYPTHGEIVAARDRMVEQHPDLRVIGAHLGSLEYDVAEIARRLEAFPNFAVDTSARMKDLARQDSRVVSEFLERYSDRVLWGTDQVCRDPFSEMSHAERQQRLEKTEQIYRTEWAYYETAQPVTVSGREVIGLGLSAAVLDRLYRQNALTWYDLSERW